MATRQRSGPTRPGTDVERFRRTGVSRPSSRSRSGPTRPSTDVDIFRKTGQSVARGSVEATRIRQQIQAQERATAQKIAAEKARQENLRKQQEATALRNKNIIAEQQRINALRLRLNTQGAQRRVQTFTESKTGDRIQHETLINRRNERIFIVTNLTTGKKTIRTFEGARGRVRETGGLTDKLTTQKQANEIQSQLASGDRLVYDTKNMKIIGIKSKALGQTIKWDEKGIAFYNEQIAKLGKISSISKPKRLSDVGKFSITKKLEDFYIRVGILDREKLNAWESNALKKVEAYEQTKFYKGSRVVWNEAQITSNVLFIDLPIALFNLGNRIGEFGLRTARDPTQAINQLNRTQGFILNELKKKRNPKQALKNITNAYLKAYVVANRLTQKQKEATTRFANKLLNKAKNPRQLINSLLSLRVSDIRQALGKAQTFEKVFLVSFFVTVAQIRHLPAGIVSIINNPASITKIPGGIATELIETMALIKVNPAMGLGRLGGNIFLFTILGGRWKVKGKFKPTASAKLNPFFKKVKKTPVRNLLKKIKPTNRKIQKARIEAFNKKLKTIERKEIVVKGKKTGEWGTKKLQAKKLEVLIRRIKQSDIIDTIRLRRLQDKLQELNVQISKLADDLGFKKPKKTFIIVDTNKIALIQRQLKKLKIAQNIQRIQRRGIKIKLIQRQLQKLIQTRKIQSFQKIKKRIKAKRPDQKVSFKFERAKKASSSQRPSGQGRGQQQLLQVQRTKQVSKQKVFQILSPQQIKQFQRQVIKQKQVQRQLQKQVSKQKVKQVQIQRQLQRAKPKLRQRQLQRSMSASLSMVTQLQRQLQRSAQAINQAQKQLSKSATLQKQAQQSKSMTAQAVLQLQKQISRTKQIAKTKQVQKTEKKKLIKFTKKKRKPTRILSKAVDTFFVKWKVRGKFVRNKYPLVLGEAKDLLATNLDFSPSRTAQLIPAGRNKIVGNLPSSILGYFRKTSKKYRPYKIVKKKAKPIRGYIEKRKYALDKPSERARRRPKRLLINKKKTIKTRKPTRKRTMKRKSTRKKVIRKRRR